MLLLISSSCGWSALRNMFVIATWLAIESTPLCCWIVCDAISSFKWIKNNIICLKTYIYGLRSTRVNSSMIKSLFTYRLNWAKRTSSGWWDEWYDTALQTQDSKFVPWRSKAEHNIESLRVSGKTILFLWHWTARVGFEPAISDFPSRQF